MRTNRKASLASSLSEKGVAANREMAPKRFPFAFFLLPFSL